MLKGSFAIVMLTDGEDKLYFARYKSPLIIGIGEGEVFLASDMVGFLKHTNRAIFLEERDIGMASKDAIFIENLNKGIVRRPINTITISYSSAEKEGYDHFMLKEILEQPRVIYETVVDPNIGETAKEIFAKDLVITAAGTSYHAGLIAKYLFNTKIDVIIASEFRELYRGGNVLAISQSGETADTLEAVRYAKGKGAKIFALVNVMGSTLARMADKVLYTHAGIEIGVAATKTFATQLAAIFKAHSTVYERKLPDLAEEAKATIEHAHEEAKKLSKVVRKYKDIFFIGRGILYPIAMEGALKLKEITYLHAEAYAGGELKHGPIALIDDNTLVFALVQNGSLGEKILANVEEVKARGAKVVVVAHRENKKAREIADYFLPVEYTDELYSAISFVIPLQLVAYYTAVELGRDPDKPRNLAKSVTVE